MDQSNFIVIIEDVILKILKKKTAVQIRPKSLSHVPSTVLPTNCRTSVFIYLSIFQPSIAIFRNLVLFYKNYQTIDCNLPKQALRCVLDLSHVRTPWRGENFLILLFVNNQSNVPSLQSCVSFTRSRYKSQLMKFPTEKKSNTNRLRLVLKD